MRLWRRREKGKNEEKEEAINRDEMGQKDEHVFKLGIKKQKSVLEDEG